MYRELKSPVSVQIEITDSLWKAGARIFLTSILSYDEREHNFLSQREGSFTETINGIKNALNIGFIVAVNMVLTKINIENLFRTAEYLASLGIKNFSATKVSPALDSRDMKKLLLSKEEIEGSLETLVEVKNRFGMNINVLECYPLCLIKDGEKYSELISRNCAAGINTLTIGANGDIRPCSHSNLFYGNIFEENLESIWRKMQETVHCLKECDQTCFHQCDNCYTVCDCLSCYK